MKRTLLPALFVLLLTACTSDPTTLSYNVTFDTKDNARRNDLSLATRHVIERRLERLGGFLLDYDIAHDDETDTTQIDVRIDDPDAAKALDAEMLAPFHFELRYLVSEPQEGDIAVEGTGHFRASGIGKPDVDWVIGETTEPPLNRGRVLIGFTDEGSVKMEQLFTEQNGNTVGLFVRERLTAAVKIAAEDFDRVMVIEGLPSGELAKVFADDMNVGIHMTFSPLK